jgi:hypothetical protein
LLGFRNPNSPLAPNPLSKNLLPKKLTGIFAKDEPPKELFCLEI